MVFNIMGYRPEANLNHGRHGSTVDIQLSSANTWYSVATSSNITNIGTYYIFGTSTITNTASGTNSYLARIVDLDKSITYLENQETQSNNIANAVLSLNLNGIVVITQSATISMQLRKTTSTVATAQCGGILFPYTQLNLIQLS